MKLWNLFRKAVYFILTFNVLLLVIVGMGVHPRDSLSAIANPSAESMLLQRAQRAYESEKTSPGRDLVYLNSLSQAIRFQDFSHINDLLNTHELRNN